jgi:L-fuconolactonase
MVSMNRRAFLNGLLAMEVLAAQTGRIVDTHVHFYDPTRPQGVPWPPKTEPILYKPMLPDAFGRLTRPLGVSGVIVIEASPLVEDNEWVLDLAKGHPIIQGFIGNLEPGQPEFKANLARFAKDPLFHGIRLGEPAIARALKDPAVREDVARLADAGLTLDAIGSAGLLSDLVILADQHPTLRIVIDHMPFDEQPEAVLQELAQRPRIYAKVSGVLRPGPTWEQSSVDALWTAFGPGRMIYGSNWPVSERIAPYSTVLGTVQKYFAAKGAESFEKLFWRNSLAAYRR